MRGRFLLDFDCTFVLHRSSDPSLGLAGPQVGPAVGGNTELGQYRLRLERFLDTVAVNVYFQKFREAPHLYFTCGCCGPLAQSG